MFRLNDTNSATNFSYQVVTENGPENCMLEKNTILQSDQVMRHDLALPYVLMRAAVRNVETDQVIRQYSTPCFVYPQYVQNENVLVGSKRHGEGVSIDSSGLVKSIAREPIEIDWEVYHQQQQEKMLVEAAKTASYTSLGKPISSPTLNFGR